MKTFKRISIIIMLLLTFISFIIMVAGAITVSIACYYATPVFAMCLCFWIYAPFFWKRKEPDWIDDGALKDNSTFILHKNYMDSLDNSNR